VVESQPSKLLVAGSIPVSRSSLRQTLTAFAAAAGKPDCCDAREMRKVRLQWRADLSAEATSEASVWAKADVAQLAERVLGKDEVTSSILVIGSNLRSPGSRASYGWRASSQAKVVRQSATREGGLQQ
jgi:hypothetical protein